MLCTCQLTFLGFMLSLALDETDASSKDNFIGSECSCEKLVDARHWSPKTTTSKNTLGSTRHTMLAPNYDQIGPKTEAT
jgi:hypothetical protein